MDLDNLAESQFLKALDALYERGGDDQYAGLKFDPRGSREYQAVLDLARAALAPPEGYVLVQHIDAKRLCDGDTNSPGWALSARRVQAGMRAARPEVP